MLHSGVFDITYKIDDLLHFMQFVSSILKNVSMLLQTSLLQAVEIDMEGHAHKKVLLP